MFSGQQCNVASPTGRLQGSCDFTAFRSHHHLPRLPLPCLLKCTAQVCRKPLQASIRPQQQQVSSQVFSRSRRQRQYRCCHNATSCTATSAHIEPDRSKPPSLFRNIRTAAVLAAVFGIWCCISANTQPSSAFASVTTALTDAGAPPLGTNSQHRSAQSSSPTDGDNLCLLTLQLHKEQSGVAMLVLQLVAYTLLQA